MEKNRKIIIAAGGTGGHLYPGIALARVLRQRGCESVFIGKENDPGIKTVLEEGFDFREIPAQGLSGLGVVFSAALKNIAGFMKAYRLIKSIKPLCVIGMGSYVSFPAVLAGKILGLPCYIHEQNYKPGLTNIVLAKFAGKIAVSYKESAKYFPAFKTVLTGNPVRPEILSAKRDESLEKYGFSKDRFTVFAFGGSQGASRINKTILETLRFLDDFKQKIQIIHITGRNDFERVSAEYKKYGIKYAVLGYLESIGEAYSMADLVVCRSGATTCAELSILGINAILVPYPHATGDHQRFNAIPLVESGQAEMMAENILSGEKLAQAVITRLKNYKGKAFSQTVQQPSAQAKLADLVLAKPL